MADVEIRGLERFRSTMRRAVDELGDMKAGSTAAGVVISREGSSRAPRRTGRLASSIVAEQSQGRARISSALAYAGVIHYGNPHHGIEPRHFLTGAAAATESQWLEGYEHDAQSILDRVRGA